MQFVHLFAVWSDTGVQEIHVTAVKRIKGTVVQCFADTEHQVVVTMKVVHHGQPHTQHLVSLESVAQIRAGEIAAALAGACLVQRLFIQFVFRVFDVDDALPSVQKMCIRDRDTGAVLRKR